MNFDVLFTFPRSFRDFTPSRNFTNKSLIFQSLGSTRRHEFPTLSKDKSTFLIYHKPILMSHCRPDAAIPSAAVEKWAFEGHLCSCHGLHSNCHRIANTYRKKIAAIQLWIHHGYMDTKGYRVHWNTLFLPLAFLRQTTSTIRLREKQSVG